MAEEVWSVPPPEDPDIIETPLQPTPPDPPVKVPEFPPLKVIDD